VGAPVSQTLRQRAEEVAASLVTGGYLEIVQPVKDRPVKHHDLPTYDVATKEHTRRLADAIEREAKNFASDCLWIGIANYYEPTAKNVRETIEQAASGEVISWKS
jgi:superfamily II DNA/RNA helicase